MPRSVPDDEVMKKQQATDRKAAPKRKPATKSKSAAKKAQPAKAPAPKAQAARQKRKDATKANKELKRQARTQAEPVESPAKEVESDVRANRGLGAIFRFFRRSRGEKSLKRAAGSQARRGR